MTDERPPIAIGHVSLRVLDITRAARFYVQLGLREVMVKPAMAIFELRGGTHLMLFRAKGKPRKGPVHSFDFMVDDLDALRDQLMAEGIICSEIEADEMSDHRSFDVADPDGHLLSVYSSHTSDRAV